MTYSSMDSGSCREFHCQIRACPSDTYPPTVKDTDRQIMASSNDRKKTRSTTLRLGPAVPAGPHPESDTENHPRAWRPNVARPGRHGCLPAKGHGSRKQKQDGRIVPVRQVAVCCLGGGKIDDGAAVQAPAGLESAYIHEDSKSGKATSRIAAFNAKALMTMSK